MKALIIGLGYLGSAVAKMWQAEGIEVSVTTSTPSRVPELQKHYSAVHLASDLKSACKGQDLIFVAVAPKQGATYEETYLKVANELKEHAKCKVIWISSTSVYMENSGGVVTEDSPTDGDILDQSEKRILALPESVVLRLGEITGPGREHLDKLKRLQGKTLPGTGDSFVNASPLPLILEAIEVIRKKNASGVFNICSDERPTRLELYSKLAQENNLKLPTYDPTLKSRHSSKKRVESAKIKKLLS